MNSAAYIGCGALNLAIGKMLESNSSRNGLFMFRLLICAAAIIITAVCSAIWKKFISK